jgi:vitamin B12 transporter
LLCLLGAAACLDHALAQSSQPLPDIVVTATRGPESIARTGSAISVVTEADIAASNPLSLVDALRGVPGLDVSETGGPGATTSVRLRGANPGQTLVLIDGVRVNDPAAASGDYDFSMVPVGAIERVEVLRGPQSALYGSDAIGGVVNIITKKGGGPAQFNLRTEAGSYGTLSSIGSLTGSSGPWSYAFTGAGQRADGFSRYGYRIPSIEARFPNLEPDGFDRWAGSARVGYDAGQGLRFDAGVLGTRTRLDYDQASGAFPDTPSNAVRRFEQGWARAAVDTGALTHNLHVFANRTDRSFTDVTYRINTLPQNTTSIITDFIGDRVGGEYQGNLRMGAFGSLTFGAKSERETANTFAEQLQPTARPRMPMLAGEQTTHAGFALWQLPIADRLILTLGGRVDDVVNVDRFETWRATAAYLIPESGTKLRGSAGTGGKAPTLFQLFAPTFGNPSLQSEESFGWDAGIDQTFLGGRGSVSVTWFENKLSNLIEFDSLAMRYFNVARATTSGLEVGADTELWPDWVRLKAAYTYLRAHDAVTGLTLQRRPEHAGRVAIAVTPTPRWLIEPRLTAFSERFSSANEAGRLAPYARLDVYTDYRIDATWRVFARVENITNTRYQEVLNFGTTGRALYGGFNATW